jgi:ferredoxin
LVILGLLVAGNLFCFGCPFTLTRTLAQKLSVRGKRWPRALKNKWVSIGGILAILWLYEWLDLWASPILTAWLVIAYFAISFLLEAAFKESAFCKYVCPLGAFNFVHSTVSPLRITATNTRICQQCIGKECVNGSAMVAGCGTELFVPTIQSNMDCTLCLDCARACPYDNVALAVRNPMRDSITPPRWDMVVLLSSLAFFGMSNAFAMVSPMYTLQAWIERSLGISGEWLRLLILLLSGAVLLPLLLSLSSAWVSSLSHRSSERERLVAIASRYAPAFVPAGFGIWLAHYGFHFATGGLTIIPVMHSFMLDHGITALGPQPDWSLSYILPPELIFPLQVFSVLGGFLIAMLVAARSALLANRTPRQAFAELLPWALVLTVLAIAALSIFNLPMDMRGTFFSNR